MHPTLILLISMVAVFVLIVRLRFNAFLALIATAILIALLAPGVPLGDVMQKVSTEFGSVVGRIGISVLMAAIVGRCVMESGAAERIVRHFRWLLGARYESLALVITGYVLSIPIFSDTTFYLLIPLARAMCVRAGGASSVLYAASINAGCTATHVLVPPTPGPLAMAATLHLDLGLTMLVGMAVAAPASFCGWLFCRWIDRRLAVPIREAPGLSLQELGEVSQRKDHELPPLWLSIAPIAVPVVLISGHTIATAIDKTSPLIGFTRFFGDPNFSLMLAAAFAVLLLMRQRNLAFRQLAAPIEQSLSDAGLIILITAAGGAFGGMLELAGVSSMISAWATQLGVPLLFLAFAAGMLFKIAQGSATVAMITVSSLMAPMIAAAPPPFHPVWIGMAVASGSMAGSWMNDSGFWVFTTMSGLTETEALKSRTVLSIVLGVVAFAATLAGAWLLPLR
ncbi:MAG: SLC13 family permease [Bryobacteraceae bacterium]|nr:SLC13 family permease [Bryobacteraceae bacterium]